MLNAIVKKEIINQIGQLDYEHQRRGKYLLDTNIVIALFAEDPSVQKRIAKAAEVFIPAIVIGELFFWRFQVRSAQGKFRTYR